MGYTNVLAYRKGIPGWQKAGYQVESSLEIPSSKVRQISPSKLQAMKDDIYLVDIRGNERNKVGVIPGTNLWLPLLKILDGYSEIPQDKTVVIYDTADKMTLIAGRFLSSKGYNVSRLGGGIVKWIGAGLSVEPAK